MSNGNGGIWNLLFEYPSEIALIISIVSLITTFIFNYFVRKRLIMTQYKLNYISEIYPELLSNIRQCLTEYDKFKETGMGLLSKLSVLRNIYIDGRIEFIRTTNKSLFDNLEILHGDFLKKTNELQDLRIYNFRNIKQRWGDYLHGIEPHIHFPQRAFGEELHSAVMHLFIKEKYDEIRNMYDEKLEKKVAERPEFMPFPDGVSDILIEIVKEEIKDMIALITEIDEIVEETIRGKVIPNMEKTIGNPS